MRWDGQALRGGEQGQGELLAPGAVPGLLRTVRTPELAGTTFHEVRARSTRNAVPAGSAMPFRCTVDPHRGCTHACVHCLSGDTQVLMADGRQRALADLRRGDRGCGTDRGSTHRRCVATEVLDHWQTVRPAHRVVLEGGTTLVASGGHRFLTGRGWKHVTGDVQASGRRPHLTGDDRLLGLGADPAEGAAVTGRADLRVVPVEALGVDLPVDDTTTGTGGFIAGGVVSHDCFARGTHAWLDLDTGTGFDTELVVEVDVAERLRAEVTRATWQREHVALGTSTDPYQRAEGGYRLVPGIVDALHGSGTPFSVLTKGTLLRRDLPLLAAAARDVPLGVGVSIAVWGEALHRAVEPGAPSPRARLDLVRAVRDAGLPCGVLMAPVLPGPTGSTEQLDAALAPVAAAGATGVTVVPLHLRPGARGWWTASLSREHPELVGLYARLYRRGAYLPRAHREECWWCGASPRPSRTRPRGSSDPPEPVRRARTGGGPGALLDIPPRRPDAGVCPTREAAAARGRPRSSPWPPPPRCCSRACRRGASR